MKLYKKEGLQSWIVVGTTLAYYAIFCIVPLAMLFFYSFTDKNMLSTEYNFIGLKNYIDMFRYPEYLSSFAITFIISFFIVLIGFVIGFLIAVVMTSPLIKGKTIFRTIWYIPAVISMIVISLIVNLVIKYEGAANNIIKIFGGKEQLFTESVFWMYFFIIFVVVWKGMGGTIILFIAGLNSISKECYEAASIDGANGLQKLWHITFPLLKPMSAFLLITGVIGAFNIFEPVMLISAGRPDGKTKVILYRIYDESFQNFKQGFGNALSVMVLIVVFILTAVNMKLTDQKFN